MILQHTKALSIATDPKTASKLKPKTDKLNKVIIDKCLTGQPLSYLASPVTGGAISMPSNQIIFISGLQKGKKTADQLAKYTQTILHKNNQFLVRNGQQIKSPKKILETIKSEAESFFKEQIPFLEKLKII